jgi:hypothetical protein
MPAWRVSDVCRARVAYWSGHKCLSFVIVCVVFDGCENSVLELVPFSGEWWFLLVLTVLSVCRSVASRVMQVVKVTQLFLLSNRCVLSMYSARGSAIAGTPSRVARLKVFPIFLAFRARVHLS